MVRIKNFMKATMEVAFYTLIEGHTVSFRDPNEAQSNLVINNPYN